MDKLPGLISASGVEFIRVDSPDGLACWTSRSESPTVSIVIEPAAPPDRTTIAAAELAVQDFAGLVRIAQFYLAERLRRPEYGLSLAELTLLDEVPAPFEAPEIVVWADGTSMVRFAHSALPVVGEMGIAVMFAGADPERVEDFAGAVSVDDD